MEFHCPHFRTGVALTALIGLAALCLAEVPGLGHIGALTLALLFGIAFRGFLHVPERQHCGIGFSARNLLRIGIVLIGVRLDFNLLLHAGFRIFLLAATVVAIGIPLIMWIGRRFGLRGMLPLLLGIDSSICGASAVAAATPVLRAREEDTALVISVCSLLGTAGVLSLTAAQHLLALPPTTFGILAGSTLHEVAQVMAAGSAIPNAMEPGTVAKLMRVALLAPTIWILDCILNRKSTEAGATEGGTLFGSVWFVFGFLIVGAANTMLIQWLGPATVAHFEKHILVVANFLMAMAMAGLGLQVDFARLRENGLRTAGAAACGWLLLVAFASVEIYFMRL